jgi:membrane fusion protein, multidrug efflux system
VQRSSFTLIIGLLCVFLLAACQSRKVQSAGPPPGVPVTVATASVQAAPEEIRVVGTVEPSAKVEVKSQIAGQLMSVHFNEGQNINQGQPLFEIDPQPYREALRQAEATIERDRAQLNQAEVAVQKDIVQSKAAEADAARFDTLTKERLISKQQNLQYRTSADVAKESIRADQAAVESSRASLKMDQSAVQKAKLDLSYCSIRAPISGRAGNLLVYAGNLVKANDVPLVVINRIAPIFVSFNAPEKHLETIRGFSANHKLPVQVRLRDNPGAKVTGYLSVVDNTVDTQTGTIHLKATVENGDRLLWPGQFVDVVLTLDRGLNATVIPSEAVQAGQQGSFVYVVKPDKSVEPRVVSVGRMLDRKVIIENGLNPGETVVTDGQMLLFPGAHVAVVATPKNDPGPQ